MRPAGNCSAGGYYTDAAGHAQAFVVTEINGSWGTAQEVPGTAALNKGDDARAEAVSCGAAGNCSAAGIYNAGSLRWQGLVVSQVNGAWGKAEAIPGLAALNQGGDAGVSSVSCASAGHCSAGGSYADASGAGQPFVVDER